jgi:hypothetical protein
MDQLMLSLVLSIGAARVLRTAANKTNDSRSVATQPPLPLTPQRLGLIKALAKEMSRSPDERIAQPPPRQPIIAQNDRRPGGQVQPTAVTKSKWSGGICAGPWQCYQHDLIYRSFPAIRLRLLRSPKGWL